MGRKVVLNITARDILLAKRWEKLLPSSRADWVTYCPAARAARRHWPKATMGYNTLRFNPIEKPEDLIILPTKITDFIRAVDSDIFLTNIKPAKFTIEVPDGY